MAYIGQSIKNGTFTTLDTSGNTYNGSNTAFALGTQVGSPAQLLVSHDGVIQKPGTDYTLSSGGTAITFTTAPASGASIFIVEISGAVGGPLGSDLNGSELILDADGDTSIHASTDDQIDIKISGADDFKFSANAMNVLSGSTLTVDSGATLTVSGSTNLTNAPAFEANLSGNQTVSNDTTTKAAINTEVFDSDGCYDNSTNYRFTPTTAGNYHVFGRVRGQSATENDIKSVSAFIYKNGSALFQGNQSNYNEATQHDIDVTVDLIVNLNGSGDYVELFGNVFGTSGAFRFALRDTRFGAYKLIGV